MEGRMGGRKEDEMTAGRGFDSQPGPLNVQFACVCMGFLLVLPPSAQRRATLD